MVALLALQHAPPPHRTALSLLTCTYYLLYIGVLLRPHWFQPALRLRYLHNRPKLLARPVHSLSKTTIETQRREHVNMCFGKAGGRGASQPAGARAQHAVLLC